MAEINTLMREMPREWRGYWCESQVCACLGCANGAGGLAARGILKSEWAAWCKANHTEIDLRFNS